MTTKYLMQCHPDGIQGYLKTSGEARCMEESGTKNLMMNDTANWRKKKS